MLRASISLTVIVCEQNQKGLDQIQFLLPDHFWQQKLEKFFNIVTLQRHKQNFWREKMEYFFDNIISRTKLLVLVSLYILSELISEHK